MSPIYLDQIKVFISKWPSLLGIVHLVFSCYTSFPSSQVPKLNCSFLDRDHCVLGSPFLWIENNSFIFKVISFSANWQVPLTKVFVQLCKIQASIHVTSFYSISYWSNSEYWFQKHAQSRNIRFIILDVCVERQRAQNLSFLLLPYFDRKEE